MKPAFLLTPDAAADLSEIVEFVQADSTANAMRLIDEFERAFHLIARRRRIGHRRDDLADETLRVFPLHSFLIIYRPETSPVQVIRKLHGARDLNAFFTSRA